MSKAQDEYDRVAMNQGISTEKSGADPDLRGASTFIHFTRRQRHHRASAY